MLAVDSGPTAVHANKTLADVCWLGAGSQSLVVRLSCSHSACSRGDLFCGMRLLASFTHSESLCGLSLQDTGVCSAVELDMP